MSKNTEDNIRVVCRFRPLNNAEIQNSEAINLNISNNKTIEIKENKKNNRDSEHKFTFDHVFDMETEQKQVFDIVAKPVMEGVFEGWNGSILAYGQTSSGCLKRKNIHYAGLDGEVKIERNRPTIS
jgi:kinesin family protein 5